MLIKKVVSKAHSFYIIRKYKSNPYMLSSEYLHDYKEHKMPYYKIYAIHKKGYTVEDWQIMDITNDNYKEYLSSADYRSLHPINGQYSKWIDDKLTLKYLCVGTDLDKYMPKYYYQIDDKGNVLNLPDCKDINIKHNIKDIINLLKDEKILALKLISGSIGAGFYKLEYKQDKFFMNGKECSEEDIIDEIALLKNYLVTEYLKPHKDTARFCPNTANTMRYLVGKKMDGQLSFIRSYIRFGTRRSNNVENFAVGGVLCFLSKDGVYDGGYVLDDNLEHKIKINEHPDSKEKLFGKVPMWNEIEECVKNFCNHFPQMKYLGFDFVITDKNEVKMLEINSLTSLDGFQMDGGIFNTKWGDFFKELIKINR